MDTSTPNIYTYLHPLSLHDALPIWTRRTMQRLHAIGPDRSDACTRRAGHGSPTRRRSVTAPWSYGDLAPNHLAGCIARQQIAGDAPLRRHLEVGQSLGGVIKQLRLRCGGSGTQARSEAKTSELQSIMRTSYGAF